MTMEHQTAETLIEDLTAALHEITGGPPHLIQEPYPGNTGYRPDAAIDVEFDGRFYRLIIEAKRSLFPRDAREAIWQFRNYLDYLGVEGRPAVPLLMAESISPGARQLLRDERVGYFDASGSLFITASGLYLRVDRPASRKQARSLNNLFAGRRAQALHAVWLFEDNWFGVHEVAERAGVSPATASETLIGIERREWVEVRGAGPSKERRLINPRALLDAWASHQASEKPKALRHFYVRATTPGDIQHRIDDTLQAHGIPYEFSSITAGQTHAPYLSSISQVFCRIPARIAISTILESIGARPVREGWNLGVHEVASESELRFRERIDGLWVADPLQAYLDLIQAGGRAKELAQHLRAEKLEQR